MFFPNTLQRKIDAYKTFVNIVPIKALSKEQFASIGGQFLEAEQIIDQLQAELAKYRWIPVAERLPEKEGGVTLYEVICGGHILERCFYKETWLRSYTHWRPIILPLDFVMLSQM